MKFTCLLTLPTVAILTLTVSPTLAQNVDYDEKPTQALQSPTGFQTLNMGKEITEDNLERELNAEVPELNKTEVDVLVNPAPPQAPIVYEIDTVMGNTDTGVTRAEIQKALDKHMN
jgi:hypothetical protein